MKRTLFIGAVLVAFATAASGATLGLFGLITAPGTSFAIVDNIPEPETAVLLALGLLSVALLGRASPSSPGASRGRPGRARAD